MLVSAVEGHRLWAPVYDTNPNPVLALESRIVGTLLGPIPGRRFVDVACGTGRWTAYLQQRGGLAFGADCCAEMLNEARSKAGLPGTLVLADAASLPFRSGAADVCICSFAAGYLPELNRVFAELARVTKKGGTVLVSDLHPEGIAKGWTRSFRIEDTTYELRHFGPNVDSLLAAGRHANLTLQRQIDARFGLPEQNLFHQSGKDVSFAELSAIPAVWIGIWANL